MSAGATAARLNPTDLPELHLFIDDLRNEDEARGLAQAVTSGATVVARIGATQNQEALLRLVEMGVSPYVLARNLLATVARRVFRRLCPACRQERELSAEQAAMPFGSSSLPVRGSAAV